MVVVLGMEDLDAAAPALSATWRREKARNGSSDALGEARAGGRWGAHTAEQGKRTQVESRRVSGGGCTSARTSRGRKGEGCIKNGLNEVSCGRAERRFRQNWIELIVGRITGSRFPEPRLRIRNLISEYIAFRQLCILLVDPSDRLNATLLSIIGCH